LSEDGVCSLHYVSKNVLTLGSCSFDKHGLILITWSTASAHFQK